MAEPAGEGRWRAGAPVRVGPVTVLPIERVAVDTHRLAGIGWVSAALEPVGLVVHDAAGLRVLGLGDEPLSLADLRARIPGLGDVLAGI